MVFNYLILRSVILNLSQWFKVEPNLFQLKICLPFLVFTNLLQLFQFCFKIRTFLSSFKSSLQFVSKKLFAPFNSLQIYFRSEFAYKWSKIWKCPLHCRMLLFFIRKVVVSIDLIKRFCPKLESWKVYVALQQAFCMKSF